MRLVLDTSVLIDHLRGRAPGARALIEGAVERGDELWSSHVVRVEVLAGMRPGEEAATRQLLQLVDWVELDEALAESAGELGRRYLRTHPGIEVADLVIAALARQLDAELKTQNLKHFPMFPGLRPAY